MSTLVLFSTYMLHLVNPHLEKNITCTRVRHSAIIVHIAFQRTCSSCIPYKIIFTIHMGCYQFWIGILADKKRRIWVHAKLIDNGFLSIQETTFPLRKIMKTWQAGISSSFFSGHIKTVTNINWIMLMNLHFKTGMEMISTYFEALLHQYNQRSGILEALV